MIRKESITAHIAIRVEESSQVGEARRIASMLAFEAGFGETEAGKVAIIATELATNLLKHATHGEILVRIVEEHQNLGIEILALDNGKGIPDLQQSLEDGFSTSGTRGNGLGAIKRLADFFDVYTAPRAGTVIVVRVWTKPPKHVSRDRLEYGVICRPITGEEVCGDSWALAQRDPNDLVMVVDGLGHGLNAADAAYAALGVFREHKGSSIMEILELAHGALRSTRGAAMAIAEISNHDGLLRFTGAGNIAATILANGASRSLVSHNGTVGHQMRKPHEFQYPWPKGALLIMASDGLLTHWSLEKYPGLVQRHPILIAAVLYRDFSRGRDDVTVLVAREKVSS